MKHLSQFFLAVLLLTVASVGTAERVGSGTGMIDTTPCNIGGADVAMERWGKSHYESFGRREGRTLTASRTCGDYVRKYPDLLAAYNASTGGTSSGSTKKSTGAIKTGSAEGSSTPSIPATPPTQDSNKVELTITADVEGAVLYIDGKRDGVIPSYGRSVAVLRGRHTFKITKSGYEDYVCSETVQGFEHYFPSLTKKASPTSTTLGSSEKNDSETALNADTSLELEFWQSIKDSDDPDMYKEYLRQFPEGTYAGLAKLTINKLTDTTETVASAIPNLDYGRYHALVIGNNDYDYLSDLKTAVNDAESIASLLKEDYGFEVSLLKNATRAETVSALARFRKTVSANDSLLIYYAGHGHLDEAADEGYWLPVDSNPDDPSNWLENGTVVGQIRAMDAKHVMIVADSCFSGTLTRAIKIELRTPSDLQKIIEKKARTALTSGGLEPVLDSRGGDHSVFAKSFISLLEENPGVLDAHQLFSSLRTQVALNSRQIPEYGNIHEAGHDGGDFLFVKTAKISAETAAASTIEKPTVETVPNNTAEVSFWETIKDSDDAEMYHAYLQEFPEGKFVSLAKIKLKNLEPTAQTVVEETKVVEETVTKEEPAEGEACIGVDYKGEARSGVWKKPSSDGKLVCQILSSTQTEPETPQNTIVGAGFTLQEHNGRLYVVKIFADTPIASVPRLMMHPSAYAAGLSCDDCMRKYAGSGCVVHDWAASSPNAPSWLQLWGIDGINVRGKSVTEAYKLLDGQVGTSVRLSFGKGAGRVTVKRGKFNPNPSGRFLHCNYRGSIAGTRQIVAY